MLAGPGSGKTTVIVGRINYLLEQGISPESIAALTFTNAAAGELNRRTGKRILCSTFHSFFLRILNSIDSNQRIGIITFEEKKSIAQEFLHAFSANKEKISLDQLMSYLSDKRNLLEVDRELKQAFLSFYGKRKRELFKFDFDDIEAVFAEKLRQKELELMSVVGGFRYYIVDEAQDLNDVQYEILRKIAAPENNCFLVGDDDQSIYGFRGSNPRILRRFNEEFPGCQTYTLGTNYRCGSNIVNTTSAFIRHNKNRIEKSLVSGSRVPGRVCFYRYKNKAEECSQVARIVRDVLNREKDADIAILTRTHWDGEMIKETLSEYGISYTGKDNAERSSLLHVKRDLTSFFRVTLGIGDREDIFRIERILDLQSGEVLKIPEFFTPDLTLRYFVKVLGYEDFLKGMCKITNSSFSDSLSYLNRLEKAMVGIDDPKKVVDLIESLCESESETDAGRVFVDSFHGSKGREFDTVFLPGLVEGVVPGKNTDSDLALEEERRAFYVAMTRAKRLLFLSCYEENGGRKANKSRFLEEIHL